MSFSDLFDVPEEEPEPERQHWVAPPWLGPPQAELPVSVAANAVLARSSNAVVVLSTVLAYSTGLSFELHAHARGLSDRDAQRLFHEQHVHPSGDEPSPGFMRVGVELADGSRASNLVGRRPPDLESPPDGPVLFGAGGGGGSSGSGAVSMRPAYWLWPVPPPGPLRLFCEWPIVDVPLSSVELDGAALREASPRAAGLWDD